MNVIYITRLSHGSRQVLTHSDTWVDWSDRESADVVAHYDTIDGWSISERIAAEHDATVTLDVETAVEPMDNPWA